MNKLSAGLALGALISVSPLWAQDNLEELKARGAELYNIPASCGTCHAADGTGGIGPDLLYGPTPYDIAYQFTTNPEMGPVGQMLDASHDDLLAMSVYIRDLAGNPVTSQEEIDSYRSTMNSLRDYSKLVFPESQRDQKVREIERFETVLKDWVRKSKEGNIKHDYQMEVVAEFDKGDAKFNPEPGMTYYYQNLNSAAPGSPGTPLQEIDRDGAKQNQIAVGNAHTGEIIASYTLPINLKSSSHTTATTPDGKYVYIIGARPYASSPTGDSGLSSPSTLLKADAVTLQPVKQLKMGGRMHHIQIFQDKYMQVDTFARDENGLDVFLMDPETDQIIGGIRDEELGGISYTSFNDGEFIYVLMQPSGYGANSIPGYISASMYNRGAFTTLRPFWVAKVDPVSWEVVQEYPYPGYRGNWVTIDNNKEYMYVPAGGSSYVSKIRLEDGKIVWTVPTGTGPYGADLNADQTELWVADKGETTGMFGRTVTVIDVETGIQKRTLFSGYQVDHILLSPNGKEFWASSNAEGRLYVFNADTGDQINVIDMPGRGDPHGLAWVHYDENGESRTVRDQGGFRGGINPAEGMVLDYPVMPVPSQETAEEEVEEPEEKGWLERLFGSL